MELTTAIKHIIDGNAVILMGAGASHGAKNAFGDFPSGKKLAKDLYDLCSIEPDDENDLQDAAQTFLGEHSPLELIQEIRTRLTCASVLPAHSTIYGQPWMRYYTTNYDDVALLAAKQRGISLTPITLSANFKHHREIEHLCIHINGHISNLNEETLGNEFKLTSNSYLSEESILNSPWGELLNNDLEAAKCIVIVGLSLKYDLELSKIIFNAETTEKTIIIDAPTLSQNAENRLSRFGTVFKIGVEGFANQIENVSKTYTPHPKNPISEVYSCFIHEYHRSYSLGAPTPAQVYDLFLCGSYADELFHRTNQKYDGFVYRSKFSDVLNSVRSGTKYTFVHADMGNGKTACIEELRFKLSKTDYHIFVFSIANLSKLSGEIKSICSINAPCIVIIEDYTNCMEVLRTFALNPIKNIQFVFTARSAVNYGRMPDVFDIFSVQENESAIIDINILGTADITRCTTLFTRYGAFGKKSGLSTEQKQKLLRDKNHGNARFQSIMIESLKSQDMISKLKEVVTAIESTSENYHDAVIMILIAQIMNLGLSPTDIERVVGLEVTKDAMFRTSPAIQELLVFNSSRQSFKIKSPITASLILREIAEPQMVVDSLKNLAQYAVRYAFTPKYSNVLRSIISFSHVSSFLKEYRDPARFLANYYDSLSVIEYYQNSNFFWLQYAISCIEIADFSRAQQYLDVAYGLAPEGFEPFQINNQQARLYLEKIIKGEATNLLDTFGAAHELLMLPIVSGKDNEFNVVRLFGYYTRKEFRIKMKTDEVKQFYKKACGEAYNRLTTFLKKHPEHSQNLQELSKRLLQNAVS